MTISLKYNLLFVHIPKTAGTSIRKVMSAADRKFLDLPHLTLEEYYTFLHPDFFERIFKFAIVRNPWDRAVSLYHFHKSESFRLSDPERYAAAINMSFRQFLDHSGFMLQQLPWISLDDGVGIDVDYVGRFENLIGTMRTISEESGLPSTTLPHINFTIHPPFSTYYNDYTRGVIAEKCEEDIDEFKYTFGKATLTPQIALL